MKHFKLIKRVVVFSLLVLLFMQCQDDPNLNINQKQEQNEIVDFDKLLEEVIRLYELDDCKGTNKNLRKLDPKLDVFGTVFDIDELLSLSDSSKKKDDLENRWGNNLKWVDWDSYYEICILHPV